MSSKVKKVFKVIINTALVLYIALLAVLVIPGVFGIKNFAVTSGSMEPTIPVGSVVYVKSVDYYGISNGDVITFMISKDAKVTHRVTAIDDYNKAFVTKGDNNDMEDASPVHYENVIGKVVFHAPYFGYVLNFLSNIYGKISAVCLLFVLFVLSEFFSSKKSTDGEVAEADKSPVEEKIM